MFLHTSHQSPLFQNDKIYFALSDRIGGVSKDAFNTLNLGYYVGDNPAHVARNHQLIATRFYDIFHIDKAYRKPMYYCHQIHSSQSIVLDKALESTLIMGNPNVIDTLEKGDSESTHSICLGDGDAIITALPFRICMAISADCNPILLYDREHNVMATIHAGRKGVLLGILNEVFARLNILYGTMAQECLMYVGASIRSCCYEVGADVRDEVIQCGFSHNVIKNNRLDLIACIKAQCENLRIPSHHIEISPYCSCCLWRLFSYRREKSTGRYALLAMLTH